MATITVSNHIESPVAAVFEHFTDVEASPTRVSGIKEIQMLTPGPFRLGTRWLETRDLLGRPDTVGREVTAYERNRTYTITHHKLAARIETVFTFQELNGGTQVNLQLSLHGPGMPPGLLAPIEWAISGRVREMLSRDLADLKESV
jgi:polyketide cyclase/dehydrase/lipid transport protein